MIVGRKVQPMPEAPMPEVSSPPADIRRVRRVIMLGGGLLLLVLAGSVMARLSAEEKLHEASAAAAIPTVSVIQPKEVRAPILVLPGRLQAWSEAPVYARTNGFLKRRLVDIGDRVHAGQLLAEIEAPEVDQQLAAATAALATAQAQLDLAAVTARRWDQLASRNVVSQQAADERRGDFAAREAMRNEAAANVNRLRALISFNQVVAPFDGVVTSRATDVGALIVAGDTRSPPLFTISDKSRLRVYIRVPQAYAGAVGPGLKAQFTVPDLPDQIFTAELARVADALDVQSGAMLVQLISDNRSGLLKPGGYAQVRLELPLSASGTVVRVPASALIFRKEGMAVAVVGSDGEVAVKPVRIAQDLGADLDIGAGLSRSDWVIDSPSDAIRSGDRVRPDRQVNE
jgi:RND family efflux transporter MFP subunit